MQNFRRPQYDAQCPPHPYHSVVTSSIYTLGTNDYNMNFCVFRYIGIQGHLYFMIKTIVSQTNKSILLRGLDCNVDN